MNDFMGAVLLRM